MFDVWTFISVMLSFLAAVVFFIACMFLGFGADTPKMKKETARFVIGSGAVVLFSWLWPVALVGVIGYGLYLTWKWADVGELLGGLRGLRNPKV